jgi:CspA family cold shock protein
MTDERMAQSLMAERVEADRVMATGTVKRWSADEGCGLISPDEGDDDLVVHSESLAGGLGTLIEGARVFFEVHEGHHGLEAFGVAPLRSSS